MGEVVVRLAVTATTLTLILIVGLLAFSGSEAEAQGCHPSYTGDCLQVGIGDYDCAGGSGNGPNYVQYRVQVVGPDEFGLDGDGDGIGCEGLSTMPAQPPPEVAPDPSSDLPGVPADTKVPVAGFGPGDLGGNGNLIGLTAGLIGAGIAWLIAGGIGLGTLPRPRTDVAHGEFVPRMRMWG